MEVNRNPEPKPPHTVLGRPLEVFKLKRGRLIREGSAALVLISLMAAVGLFVFGGLETYQQYYRHGPAVILRTLIAPLTGGVLFLVVAVLAGLAAYRNWNRSIVIYENGFSSTEWNVEQTWHWTDISSIQTIIVRRFFYGLMGYNTHTYRLMRRDKVQVILDDTIDQVERLAEIVRSHAIPLMFARYNNAFNTGQRLVFGPIRIHREYGLDIGNRNYQWAQVKEITVQHGTVLFILWEPGSRNNPQVAAADIPNLDILLSIVDQIPGTMVSPDEETLSLPTSPPPNE